MWVRPLSLTTIRSNGPVVPATFTFDGYGLAGALSLSVMAPVLEKGPKLAVWATPIVRLPLSVVGPRLLLTSKVSASGVPQGWFTGTRRPTACVTVAPGAMLP